MSDCMIKIIPTVPCFHIDSLKIQEAVKFLATKTLSEDISAVIYEPPVFVDCGVNLEEIKCNFCGKILDFAWWGRLWTKPPKIVLEI